jgi:hypothetical protein
LEDERQIEEKQYEQDRADHSSDFSAAGRSISEKRSWKRPSHQHHSHHMLCAARHYSCIVADIEVTPKPNRLGDTMIRVYDNEMGALVGTITEEQLQFLIDQLEETSISDQDYYLDENTLTVLEGAGADASLMVLLRSALGDRSGCDIRWERT